MPFFATFFYVFRFMDGTVKKQKLIFAPEKSLKLNFGNFKLFCGAKIDFLPFLQ